MTALVITAGNPATVRNVTPPDDVYAWLKETVGGWLEAVRLADGCSMYLDEEGKLKGLPLNPSATILALVDGAIAADDVVVGPVVILGPVDVQGYDTPLPAGSLARILALFEALSAE